ncbi:MAG: hypothetical protein IPI33_05990 [Dehalococcoidia bacterium]|nr:hypothetical protein [Dehalococcoidia bacterium]
MEWDVGFRGLGLLALMAAGFAAVAQLLMASHDAQTRIIAGTTYFPQRTLR